jgi:hypothetical protein
MCSFHAITVLGPPRRPCVSAILLASWQPAYVTKFVYFVYNAIYLYTPDVYNFLYTLRSTRENVLSRLCRAEVLYTREYSPASTLTLMSTGTCTWSSRAVCPFRTDRLRTWGNTCLVLFPTAMAVDHLGGINAAMKRTTSLVVAVVASDAMQDVSFLGSKEHSPRKRRRACGMMATKVRREKGGSTDERNRRAFQPR